MVGRAATPRTRGDTFAKELVSRLDYDWSKIIGARHAPSITMRTTHFDNWVRQFLAVHERAVVLQLGGLDSRVFRLNQARVWSGTTSTTTTRSRCGSGSTRPASTYHLVPASVSRIRPARDRFHGCPAGWSALPNLRLRPILLSDPLDRGELSR